MLTSTLVKIQPFDLPESDSKTVASTSVVVTIDKGGNHTLNNQDIDRRALERALRQAIRTSENTQNAAVTIVAEIGTPFDHVVNIMNIAARLKVKAIIATEPRE